MLFAVNTSRMRDRIMAANQILSEFQAATTNPGSIHMRIEVGDEGFEKYDNYAEWFEWVAPLMIKSVIRGSVHFRVGTLGSILAYATVKGPAGATPAKILLRRDGARSYVVRLDLLSE